MMPSWPSISTSVLRLVCAPAPGSDADTQTFFFRYLLNIHLTGRYKSTRYADVDLLDRYIDNKGLDNHCLGHGFCSFH